MRPAPLDPLDVAGRVVQLLETGRRESTYKLATVMAIVDICVENTAAPDGSLAVPIYEITHRIIAYYWPQVRVFNRHGRLAQNRQGRSIPDRVADTRDQVALDGLRTADAAREAEHPQYRRLVRAVRVTVAQQPLTHLQTVPRAHAAGTRDDFLFDASQFHKKITVGDIDRIGVIVLRPGIPEGLRRASALLRAFVRTLWTQDVVGFNRAEQEPVEIFRVEFGADRTVLRALAEPLREIQDSRCFYCGGRIAADLHVDHVVPWSLIPIDGVANLVAADRRCNVDKSASVPVRDHVDRALGREHLHEIASTARIPVLHRRTASAAVGLYASLPAGSLLWREVRGYEPHLP